MEFLETCILHSLVDILYVAVLSIFSSSTCFCLVVDWVWSDVIMRHWNWFINVLSFVTLRDADSASAWTPSNNNWWN